MRVGLVSLDQHWQDKKKNFARCQGLVRKLAANDCQLAVFPEMTLTGYSLNVGVTAEPADASESFEWFGQLAKSSGIDLVFGSCLINSATSRPVNALCHANPQGGVRKIYEKIHPFTFAGEHEIFQSGSALGFLEIRGVCLAASICYDLRFPELYAAMARRSDGAICIANWPAGRVAHWRALLIARAIENQMYVIGVNRIGVDGNGLAYEKSSIVVDPTGEVVMPIHGSTELDTYEVDPSATRRYRKEFPTVRDKRTSIYERL